MRENRLSRLALLNMHAEFIRKLPEVIDMYANKNSRRTHLL